MKILLKGNKLFLENGKMIFLTKEMINKFSLKSETNLNEEELEELIYFRMELTAYKLLQKRDYFSRELKSKLIEKYGFSEITQEIVEDFINKSYINDEETAKSYARMHKNYGKNKLNYIFQKMGVDRDTIHEILFNMEEEELENIKILWNKLGNKSRDKKIASLLRKGFSYGDIKKVITLIEEEE